MMSAIWKGVPNHDRPLAGAVTGSVLPGLVLVLVFGTWNVVISILAPLSARSHSVRAAAALV